MTPATIRLILIGALLIVAALIFRNWLSNHDQNRDNAGAITTYQRQGEAAGGISQAAQQSGSQQDNNAAAAASSRSRYNEEHDRVMSEDASARSWGDAPVPQRLRDAARARRLERERSGDDAAGSPRSDEASADRR